MAVDPQVSPAHPSAPRRPAAARIPTRHGSFELRVYPDALDGKEHMALVHGDLGSGRDVLTRIHSECFTGDVLGSRRCDCGPQLDAALAAVVGEGRGVVVYLRQEGRGIGLAEKLRAYSLQDLGFDTVDANRLLGHAADARDYAPAVRILGDLGVRSVRLLSNNPAKVEGLQRGGVGVLGRLPLVTPATDDNRDYLRTKVERMRHLLEVDDRAAAPAAADLPGEGEITAASRRDGEAQGPVPEVVEPAEPRPFVTLTYAQSLDGSIAARRGEPLALSGGESLRLTHRLRAAHRGILVGVGTVLADDPRLTTRLGEGARDPQPVVLDRRLRTPPDSRLVAGGGPAPWIAAAPDADPRRERRLAAAGARVVRLPEGEGGIDLRALLDYLRGRRVESLMVEGGARVITSFLATRLVDHLVLTIAPRFVGGLPAVAGNGERPAVLPRLSGLRHRQLGADLVVWGRPRWA